ncbi:transporter [Ethanoligenens harbinense]|nr:transporter [Ethanoligenens harbinense YUAN-3]AYF40131.1 transporter [Ethanoligenens harbinense]AYF42971.1 transporter [Ethanoligenens harbinense]QCN93729.1 transporter [Ethanoligenens harbinense]
MCISTRNLLRGRVASITPGAVNTIVAVTLPGGQTVTACITMDAVRDMGLRVGSQVTVVINPNDVLLVC